MNTEWPHAPPHWTFDRGNYIVTSGVYRKQRLLNTAEKRDLVLHQLFACAKEFDWILHAWAVMENHYHFVARAENPASLGKFTCKLHAVTARQLNKIDRNPGRRVWFEHWDTHITNEKSWLSRLRYVHCNPVHHGLTADEESYPWCSAAWFAHNANRSLVKSLARFKTDTVQVPDNF